MESIQLYLDYLTLKQWKLLSFYEFLMKYLCRAPVVFVFGCDGAMGVVFDVAMLLEDGCQLVMSSR